MQKENMTWSDWDAEYICDRIEKLCQRFGFEVDWGDFAGARTFGDVCDIICVSVAWRYRDGGRLQQVFYRLRKAIAEVRGVDAGDIRPETRMEDIFPREGRRKDIRRLEAVLGCRLHLLEPKRWVSVSLVAAMCVSFFSILLWWQIGLAGFVMALFGFGIAVWFSLEFRIATVDEVAMELMHNGPIFVKSEGKRGGGAGKGEVLRGVNPDEITKIIVETFRAEMGLAPKELRRDVEIF